jgi:outer membrane protein insertion porin family
MKLLSKSHCSKGANLVGILLVLLLSSIPLKSSAEIFKDIPSSTKWRPKVIKIVVSGNKLTESVAILNSLGTKSNSYLSNMQLAQDIRTLWRLNKFSHIQVLHRNVKGGIVLHFFVKEKPSIKSIVVHGNKKLDLETINKVVTIKPASILNDANAKDNAVKIKQKYQEDGFYLAKVKMRLKRVKKNRVEVHYYIKEGPRVKVGGVSFSGNKQFKTKKLRSSMATRKPGIFAFLNDTNGVFKETDLKIDIHRIRNLYFNGGYIHAKIGPPEIEFSSAQNKVYVHIPIQEGLRFKIKAIDVSGTLLGPKDLMKKYKSGDKAAKLKMVQIHKKMIKSKVGAWFNRMKLAKDLKRITTYYQDKGYAYANVLPLSPINVKDQTVSVNFRIKPNKKVYIERINIIGNHKTRDKVIRREIIISEGDLYSVTRINISKKRITRLGYYKTVKLKTKKGSRDDQIIITIKVTERSTGTFNVGFGFSTVENFLLQAQVTQQNFLGRGQTLVLQAAMSSLRQFFTLKFIEPHFLDSKWYFSFALYNSMYAFESFNRETYGGSLTWGYALTPFWRVFLTYKLEDVNIDTSSSGVLLGSGSRVTIPSTAYVANLFKDGITSSVKGSISWDRRNNRMFPTKGWLMNASVEVASPNIGSQNVFNRYRAYSRFYHPIWGPFVGKFNAEIGLITSSLKSGVPIFERFFLGGINSVRGFRPYSLGPRIKVPVSPDPSAQLFSFRKGGDKTLVFNWELEFDLLKAMMVKGVFFVDAGNAYDDHENYSLSNLRASWGFGIRWYTFLGILRFEWGLPFNPQPGEDSIVFEFNIGNSF